MTETLALKYRPRTFGDVVGQKATRLVLQEMVRQNKVPTGLLFSGIRGAGKTTMGRILAAALNCTSEAGIKPCRECVSCRAVQNGNSLSVIELDAASNGNVTSIRELVRSLSYSVGGQCRVVLLDEAHSMSTEANNALLKTLEEPPPDTIFVLLTTEPGRILDTVISRLMGFEFTRISAGEIVSRLTYICDQEGFSVTPELLALLAERSQGGLRNAIMALDQVSRVGIKTVDEYREFVGESDFAPGIVRSMIEGSLSGALSKLDQVLSRSGDISDVSSQIAKCLTDMLCLKEGGEVSWQGASLEERLSLAKMVEAEKIFAALAALWALKTQVRVGEDQRGALELALVVIVRAFGNVARPVVAQTQRRLSVAEMGAMAR